MLAGLLNVASLSRIASFSLKRQVRQIVLTVVFALTGTFAALVALGIACRALYLWLELSLGTFPALGLVGVLAALVAIIFFMLAFMRRRRRAQPAAALRMRAPVTAASAATTAAAPAAAPDASGAADGLLRNASGPQLAGALAVAIIAGWFLGKRM
jgi:multisubunit Na+/H+ antiporter MnhB subunit